MIDGKTPILDANVFYGASPSSLLVNSVLSKVCGRGDTRRISEIVKRINELKMDIDVSIFTTYGGVYRGERGVRILADIWRLLDTRGKLLMEGKIVKACSIIPPSLMSMFEKDLVYIHSLEEK